VKTAEAPVAVVTADIIGSTRYGTRDRRRVDGELRQAFDEVRRCYPEAVHTKMAFRVTAGDEFQWVMSDVPRTFEVVMYLRAIVACAGLAPPIRFRASIGVGEIAVSNRENPYEEDGIAFARSRTGLEDMNKVRGPRRWTKLITGTPQSDNAADAVLCLADHMMQDWTISQWEAIRWSLLGLKREEIANKLHVAHQNVTKRLHAAGWLHFQVAAEFVLGGARQVAAGAVGGEGRQLLETERFGYIQRDSRRVGIRFNCRINRQEVLAA